MGLSKGGKRTRGCKDYPNTMAWTSETNWYLGL